MNKQFNDPSSANAVLIAGIKGICCSVSEKDFYAKEPPSGYILFSRNFSEISQFKDLILNLKSFNTFLPTIIAIDQEGGRVSRIKDKAIPDMGPALYLENGNIDLTSLNNIRKYGEALGASLSSLGINVNFAPVVDILSNENNTAIGDRVFGRSLDIALPRANAFLDGLSQHVFGCLKHFPGQGGASADTHFLQAKVDLLREHLFLNDIEIFARLCHKVKLIMVSHAIYPSLSDKPASLSKHIIMDILIDKLNFSGVVVSDDMLMKAIEQDENIWAERLCESIISGCDLLLICKSLDRYKLALEALKKKSAGSPAFAARLNEAAMKVLKLRKAI